MRLIDAGKLKNHYSWWGEDEDMGRMREIFDNIIDVQPTADTVKAHACEWDGCHLVGDVPEDGSWALFIAKNGYCEVCRYKYDAIDHFYPHADMDIEDVAAWVSLDEVRKLAGVTLNEG